jgi:hypothetical protein
VTSAAYVSEEERLLDDALSAGRLAAKRVD